MFSQQNILKSCHSEQDIINHLESLNQIIGYFPVVFEYDPSYDVQYNSKEIFNQKTRLFTYPKIVHYSKETLNELLELITPKDVKVYNKTLFRKDGKYLKNGRVSFIEKIGSESLTSSIISEENELVKSNKTEKNLYKQIILHLFPNEYIARSVQEGKLQIYQILFKDLAQYKYEKI
ncbi:hypothetical protein K9L97_03255 [Candidatus Woesearchaeota archaeon]|nr:hypothetical protein [Candidatus Woesearchaeota archaeon]